MSFFDPRYLFSSWGNKATIFMRKNTFDLNPPSTESQNRMRSDQRKRERERDFLLEKKTIIPPFAKKYIKKNIMQGHRFILQLWKTRTKIKKLVVRSENRKKEKRERKKGWKTFHAYIIPLGAWKKTWRRQQVIYRQPFEPDAFRLNNDRIRDAIGSRCHEDAIHHPPWVEMDFKQNIWPSLTR